MNLESDAQVVERARAGDLDAFDELVRRYSGRVYGMLARIVGDRALAEDAAQETFVRAWRAIGNFRGDAKFSTWLYRIAVNEANRLLAREARREVVPYDDTMEDIPDLASDTPAQLETLELRAQIEAGLAALPDHYRVAVVLRDVEGLSNEEAAAALDVRVENLKMMVFKSRLHRGRMALREQLERLHQDAVSDAS
ncbi:MAG: RNA polymerase sigma factor [Gaiellales bacterium]